MNRIISKYCALVLTALLFIQAGAVAFVDKSKPYFEENFNAYDAEDSLFDSTGAYGTPQWKLSNAVTYFKAVQRASGNMAAEVYTVQGNTGDLTKKIVSSQANVLTGKLEISFDYKVDSTVSGAKGVQFNVKPWTGQGICLTLTPNQIQYHNGTADGQIAVTGMAQDIWNTVVLTVDTADSPGLFDISVKNSNNTSYSATGLSARGSMAAGAGLITIASKTGTSGNAIVTFDNIIAGSYTAQGGVDPEEPEEPVLPDPVTFSQGFENDTLGNIPSTWTKNAALTSDTIGYVKTAQGNGGQCAEIYLNKGAVTSAVNFNIPPATAALLYGDVYISFDFMIDPGSEYGLIFAFFDTNDKHGITFTYDGIDSLIADQRELDPAQTVRTIAGNIQKGKWYNITFDVDMTNKIYDAYIDGVLSMDGIGFRTSSSANVRKLVVSANDLYADGVRRAYVDNITVKNRKDGYLVGKPGLYSDDEAVYDAGEGDLICARVGVKNYTAHEQALHVALAQYDAGGSLVGIAIGGGAPIGTNEEAVTVSTSDYSVKAADKMSFKSFVWGDGMKPVCLPAGLDAYEYVPKYSIYLISDSITAAYTPNYAPQVGLGMLIGDKFNGNVTVQNYAKPSRSTSSFIAEGRFALVEQALRKGDVVLIQLGHNDKGTDVPINQYKENLTKFIHIARARGAYPVLITPPSAFTSGLTSSLGDYPAAMLAVAHETAAPCIDLHAKSLALYNRTGVLADDIAWTKANIFLYDIEGAENHPNQQIRSGAGDGTHLRVSGAQLMVDFIAEEIQRLNLPFSRDLLDF